MRSHIGNAGLTAAISMALLAVPPMITRMAPVLPAGITAGGQSLAGMTAGEAKAVVQEYAGGLAAQSATLSIDGQDVATMAGGLDFHWINTDVIDEVVSQCAGGSLIKQYMIEKGLTAAPVEVELETEVDFIKVKNFMDTQCQGATAEPQNASIAGEDGQFVITGSVPGRVVDMAGAETTLNEALEGGLDRPIGVTAQVMKEQPVITSGTLATTQDVLGTYTTDSSSSGAVRSTNLAVGMAKINGCVLAPGDILSGYECLWPLITASGYKIAAAYENDQIVDDIGGGVYQLAATLYNASLKAEMGTVQRQNHSTIVTYVEPSRDAAIAGTYRDIEIKDNYNTPIHVEGYTSGRKLIFIIYGKETRPANRKVEYVSEILGNINLGEPQLIVNNTLAPGARVEVRSSHTGLRSRLWKVVAVDDMEQERAPLNEDTYNTSKAIYWVGPDLSVVLPVMSDMMAPVDTAPAETASVTGVEEGPGVAQSTSELAPTPEANPTSTADLAPETDLTPTAGPIPTQGGPVVIPMEGPQCVWQDRDRTGLRSATAL